jgi:hypothetical protein
VRAILEIFVPFHVRHPRSKEERSCDDLVHLYTAAEGKIKWKTALNVEVNIR